MATIDQLPTDGLENNSCDINEIWLASLNAEPITDPEYFPIPKLLDISFAKSITQNICRHTVESIGLFSSMDIKVALCGEMHMSGKERVTRTITAFEQSPDRGQGLARDMSVRWALEEVGQPYEVRLVSFSEMKETAHRAIHPFGQIPTYEEGDLALFESGAIVFHIAERHEGLLPAEANARARAIMWMFAALSTMEPTIVQREIAIYLERDKPWYEQRLRIVEDRIRIRLEELSKRLGDAKWLDEAFSAGDLLMVQVLRRLNGSSLMEEYPNLASYVARGEARPAFKRAFAAQRAVFTGRH